jgi:2-hydroxy-3-oxopropionate reductase
MTGMRIAFLGTGIMGAPMARNLARAGHEVVAWNRSPDKAEALRQDGIPVAASAGAAVAGADAIILMLSTGPVCDEVLFGDGSSAGVAGGLRPGATVVVMSSIPVGTARCQAVRLGALGVGYLDAPVSGGERGAITATLSIMAGGSVGDIETMRPMLQAMGRLTHVGPQGSGQLAKLANQLIVGVTIGAIAEALVLAEAGGADPAAVREALLGGFADSTILKQHGERMLGRNFTPGARAEVQLKDLRTGRAQAEEAGCDLPFLALAEQLYERMCAGGRSGLDHSALYLELRDRCKPRVGGGGA